MKDETDNKVIEKGDSKKEKKKETNEEEEKHDGDSKEQILF